MMPLAALTTSDFATDNDEEEDDEAMRLRAYEEAQRRARKKDALNKWAEAEADRLAAVGAREREAERQADIREAHLEAERKHQAERTETIAPGVSNSGVSNSNAGNTVEERRFSAASSGSMIRASAPVVAAGVHQAKDSRPAAAVTPAGRAVVAPAPPGKRPAAKASMSLDEVREKVTAQIRKALPAIAAAQATRQNGGRSG